MMRFDKSASFGRDQDGAVAIMFGLLLFVLVGTVGLALDVARGNDAKAALQQNLDATLIFVAVEKARQGADYDVAQSAQSYMDGLNRSKHLDGTFSLTVSMVDDLTVKGTVNARVRTQFMRIVGVNDYLDINVASTVSGGQSPMEIALVLDNTTSMAGAKLTALQDAANSLIDTVFDAAGPGGDLKVGVVPFAEYVNVGLSRRNEPWIEVPNDVFSNSSDLCPNNPGATMIPNTCQQVTNTYTFDGVTYSDNRSRCDFTPPGGGAVFQCNTVDKVIWRGCVGSRPYPFDTRDDTYGSNKVPGLLDKWCPTELTPLTNNRDTVKTAISELEASGNTYIAPGLMWGWAVLSPDEPFTQGRKYKEIVNGRPLRKVMVLMTDGENVRSPDYPYHWDTNVPRANQLTAEVCANIKATGIVVYTVAFDVADPTIKGVLQNCASSTSNYFDATSTTALVESFKTIAANLAALRLTE